MDHKKRRGAKSAAALLIVAAMAFTPCLNAFAEEGAGLSELRQKQSDYAAQKAENDKKIEALQADQSKQEAYRQTLLDQKQVVEGQIAAGRQQIEALEKEIGDKEAEIARGQKALDENQDLLKARLRALYMAGEASSMEILLSSESLMDLADKTEALRMVTEHDTALLEQMKDALKLVEEAKKTVEADKLEATAAKTELDERQQELTDLSAQTGEVINQLSANTQELENKNQQLAEQEAATASAIDDWLASYYAQKEEAARQQQQKPAETPKVPENGEGGTTPDNGTEGTTPDNGAEGTTPDNGDSGSVDQPQEPVDPDPPAQGSTGSLLWPVPGHMGVYSPFGDGADRGSPHKGMDISEGGIDGASIVAADGGTVIVASAGGWGGGYGTFVMIDHGNGMITIYAHMSGLTVSEGQQVSQGQHIGYVGNTGDSTGPHCHFEVRVNGVAVDPAGYV